MHEFQLIGSELRWFMQYAAPFLAGCVVGGVIVAVMVGLKLAKLRDAGEI